MNENLPLYVSHKRVRALEIADVDLATCTISFSDPAFVPRQLKGEVFARYIPDAGDFYVVYEDGYESFSPRKAFLDGYRRVTNDSDSPRILSLGDSQQPRFKLGDTDPLLIPEEEMPKSQIIAIAVGIGIILMLVVIVVTAMQFPPA